VARSSTTIFLVLKGIGMESTAGAIKVIIGLGNPGRAYCHHRHSIGFRIIDALADRYGASWHAKEFMEIAEIKVGDKAIMLIKPQTYMNTSGKVIPFLQKKGIRPEDMLVIHDELEQPFGAVKFKVGGSHKGHNGLKSIIGTCGPDFVRLRIGIGRPENKDEVSNYVLSDFKESAEEIDVIINAAVKKIEELLSQ
jgi:PTH1 family peptidyl-tRNA hydrolase